jgi:glycine oxidase
MQDSIWFQTIAAGERQVLEQSDALPKTASVAIAGAGLIGIAIAYYLTEAGVRDICLLDAGTALGEASGANAGGRWFAQQSVELGPVAPLAAASSRLYDQLAARFDFEFERPGLIELLETGESAEVNTRIEATKKAGFPVEKISGRSARSLEPGLGVTPPGALFYPQEGKLHPLKLGSALVRHLRSKGVRLCLGTEVLRLHPAVETSAGPLSAGTVVVATGAWTGQVSQSLGWTPPIRPMRGTLTALGPLPKTLHHTLVAPRFYYWQLASGHVAGGGSVDDVGFARSVEDSTLAAIRAEMNTLIPAVANAATACSWSGFRPFCEDLKPVIGPTPGKQGFFIAAGHFKKGVMLAPVTGKIVADLITKGETEFEIGPLSPSRFG